MSRTSVVVLIALGAALAGFAISSTANRIRDDNAPAPASKPAGPQLADLGWRETYGPRGQQIVFVVDSLEVTEGGWRARLGLENSTSVAYEVGDPRATLDRSFGLML